MLCGDFSTSSEFPLVEIVGATCITGSEIPCPASQLRFRWVHMQSRNQLFKHLKKLFASATVPL